MHYENDAIVFDRCDMFFVKRFGPLAAAEMVRDFRAHHSLPFIYDTYQLSTFLSMPRKNLFQMARKPDKWYYPVLLNKKNGGLRQLHVPYLLLRHVQQRILRRILTQIPISRYATAYRSGCSVRENASVHCGKTYLLKMDICDFFNSIRFDQVYSAAFHSAFFPKQIGVMLTSLCCYHDCLPQGAPTSPALSNLVMKHFDDVMGAWCEKRGITYTRYSDDLTFSSDQPLSAVYTKAKSFLEHLGFEVNEKKTCFVTNTSRQTVTGLVVNGEYPALSRQARRQLRQELYYVEKYGVADAILRGNRHDFIVDGKPQEWRYLDHLQGRVMYALHVMKSDESLLKAKKMLSECRHALEPDDEYFSYF